MHIPFLPPTLANRDFLLLAGTRVLGAAALQAQAVIVGWQVYSLSHDPFLLGLTGLAEAVPALLCALFAGHTVDTFGPHRVFLACVGALWLNMLFLLAVGGGIVPLGAGAVIGCLFAGVFVSGLLRSFIMPASFALLPQIVPREEIPAASAWISSFFQIAAIAGPAIAGIVYGLRGAQVAWMLPVGLMTFEFLCLAAMTAKPRRYRGTAVRESARVSIAAGWKFLAGSPVLLSLMALDMLAVLLGGAVALLPAFADLLSLGSEGLGLLRAAPAVGAVTTALYLALRPMRVIRGRTMLWVVAGFGVSIIGFGVSQVFWLSLVFLALSGIFDSVSVVIRSTLVQLLTPEAMRGRVSSVNSMFIISSNELGAFESGTMAKLIGIVPAVVSGGFGTLLVAGLTAWKAPGLRDTVIDTRDKAAA